MDAKLKVKWLKALRSGRYKQGDSYLKNDGKFCCLGVLAQIQGAKWVANAPVIGGEIASPADTNATELWPRFAGGLRKKTQDVLAAMNDGAGRYGAEGKGSWSFKQIAAYIEKRL